MIHWNPDELALALRGGRLDEQATFRLVVVGALLQFMVARRSALEIPSWVGGVIVTVGAYAWFYTSIRRRIAFVAGSAGDNPAAAPGKFSGADSVG